MRLVYCINSSDIVFDDSSSVIVSGTLSSVASSGIFTGDSFSVKFSTILACHFSLVGSYAFNLGEAPLMDLCTLSCQSQLLCCELLISL